MCGRLAFLDERSKLWGISMGILVYLSIPATIGCDNKRNEQNNVSLMRIVRDRYRRYRCFHYSFFSGHRTTHNSALLSFVTNCPDNKHDVMRDLNWWRAFRLIKPTKKTNRTNPARDLPDRLSSYLFVTFATALVFPLLLCILKLRHRFQRLFRRPRQNQLIIIVLDAA